jgi:hypothetical protein
MRKKNSPLYLLWLLKIKCFCLLLPGGQQGEGAEERGRFSGKQIGAFHGILSQLEEDQGELFTAIFFARGGPMRASGLNWRNAFGSSLQPSTSTLGRFSRALHRLLPQLEEDQ